MKPTYHSISSLSSDKLAFRGPCEQRRGARAADLVDTRTEGATKGAARSGRVRSHVPRLRRDLPAGGRARARRLEMSSHRPALVGRPAGPRSASAASPGPAVQAAGSPRIARAGARTRATDTRRPCCRAASSRTPPRPRPARARGSSNCPRATRASQSGVSRTSLGVSRRSARHVLEPVAVDTERDTRRQVDGRHRIPSEVVHVADVDVGRSVESLVDCVLVRRDLGSEDESGGTDQKALCRVVGSRGLEDGSARGAQLVTHRPETGSVAVVRNRRMQVVDQVVVL